MNDKLRECPICGNKELIIKDYGPQDNEVYKYFSRRYSILCVYTGNGVGCGLESGHYKTPEEAIDIWKTRHQPNHETVQEKKIKVKKGDKVIDEFGNIGIVKKAKDIHNILVKRIGGGKGFYCLDEDCYMFRDLNIFEDEQNK